MHGVEKVSSDGMYYSHHVDSALLELQVGTGFVPVLLSSTGFSLVSLDVAVINVLTALVGTSWACM
jgi:hypothetical protein